MKIGNIQINDTKLKQHLNVIKHIPNIDFFPSPKIKESWDRNHVYRYSLIIESLKKHISNSSKVLDVGVRPYSLAVLLNNIFNCKVFGICKSHNLITPLKQKKHYAVEEKFEFPKIFLNTEIDIFPFSDNLFDAVVFTEIIEHLLFSPTHALYEIHRVLKKDGILIITTPNAISLSKILRWIKRKNIFDQLSLDDIYGRHNREYTMKELDILLQNCNFKIKEKFHYTLPFDCSHLVRKILYIFPWLKEHLFIKAIPYDEPKEEYPCEIYRHSLS